MKYHTRTTEREIYLMHIPLTCTHVCGATEQNTWNSKEEKNET
jgi:hypothetical protein